MDSARVSYSIWQNVFGVSNDTAFQTIVPTIITISIFILGILLERLIESSKENKNIKTIREYVFLQVNVLKVATKLQINNLQKFISQLTQDQVTDYEFELKVDFDTKHIVDIKTNELFKILVLKSRGIQQLSLEDFNSLIKQLDLIGGLRESFKYSFKYTHEKLNEYQDRWNESVDKIGQLHDQWLTEFGLEGIDPLIDPFLKEFIKIYHTWAKIENRVDMYIAVKHLIEPVLDNARKLQPNSFAEQLLRPLLHSLNAYNNHKKLRELKIQEFEQYKSQLQNIEKELDRIYKTYSK